MHNLITPSYHTHSAHTHTPCPHTHTLYTHTMSTHTLCTDHKKTSRSSLVQTSPPINNTSKKSNLSEISPSKRSSRYSSPEGPDSKKSSRSSLLEGSATEPSTEDILARLREEQAEVPMNFPWDAIRLGKELGTGDFGKVSKIERVRESVCLELGSN